MANFPTNPTTGDTFHSGTNLYSWTGLAWKMVTGDRPDYGVVTFDPQVFPDTSGIVSLFHFDNTFVDGSSGGLSSVDGSTSPQYSTTFKWGSHSFDASNTSNRAQFAPPSITGDFTIECWVQLTSNTNMNATHHPIVSGPVSGAGNWPSPGFQLWWEGNASWESGYHGYLRFNQYNGVNHQVASTPYDIIGTDIDGLGQGHDGLVAGVWSHIVVVREITGSTCTISLYINGYRHANVTGLEIRDITFSGPNNYWVVGRMLNNAYPTYYWGQSTGGGQIDEVVVYDEAKYTGSSYTIPVGPASPVISPSAIAGKSQIYAKDVPNTPPAVLLHFDGDYTDSSGNGLTATPSGSMAFQASTLSGFGQCLNFPNANTSGNSYLTFPDPGVGTGVCTIEMFYNTDLWSEYIVFTDGYSDWGNISLQFHTVSSQQEIRIYQSDDNGSTFQDFRHNIANIYHPVSGNVMRHIALVRGAPSGGYSQWRLYLDGSYVTPTSGTGHQTTIGNLPTVDIGGQAWTMGRPPNYPAAYNYDGQIDEFRVSLTDQIYTGTGSYDIPTAPFTLPSPTTELYMMDGSGTETKLT